MTVPSARLGTVRHNEATCAVSITGEQIEILPYRDVGAYLADGAGMGSEMNPSPDSMVPRLALPEVEWAPLIVAPSKIFCLGHNYRSHIQEMDRETPGFPAVFAKYARALIGARDDIALPAFAATADWEVELGVVIGAPARHIGVDEAREVIAGFTVINDISVREYQWRTTQYLQGKTFENSTPIGPLLVPGEDVGWAADLRIQCLVDGEIVQDASTREQIFSPVEVVSYLSSVITLDPGDVIAMGTPSGVGAGRTPPRYLRDGETVESSIEGLGTLSNCVRFVGPDRESSSLASARGSVRVSGDQP